MSANSPGSAQESAPEQYSQQQLAEWVTALSRRVQEGQFRETLEPLLPVLFQLNGKPYNLTDYFAFSPLFRTSLPQSTTLKTGRQVSKSTSLAVRGILKNVLIPYFNSIYICPLFEQTRRFSANYFKPFVDQSPVKSLWVDSSVEQSVLQRTFLNHSRVIFSFASLDASRIRGLSTDEINFDELQDMDESLIPIILETMSASPWELLTKAGTPKGFDNPVEKSWQHSSQAEWIVKCPAAGCGKWNFACAELDLLGMIGPVHDDISRTHPATVCAKCRKPLDPRTGCWMHRYEERRWDNAGYHVPQCIMPLHYTSRQKWKVMVGKMEGNVAPNIFHNEVLGESYDIGSKLVTLTELKAAASLPWENNPREPDPQILARLRNYMMLVLGVDWGGGGEDRTSFTTLALCGLRNDGAIDCLWGRRLLTPNEHMREAREVLNYMRLFKPHFIAHDFNGAGRLRQTLMVQMGVAPEKIICVEYDRGTARELVKYVPATDLMPHARHRVNRTGTLLTTINAIKYGKLRFFQHDNKSEDNPGVINDFLALTEEKVESATVGDHYLIRRLSAFPDDFAHAVNYATTAIWHSTQSWPRFDNVLSKLAKTDDIGGSWS